MKAIFTKNVLKAFSPDTAVLYYINDKLIEDYMSVESYMASGLTAYDTINPGDLTITENAIEIRVYTR